MPTVAVFERKNILDLSTGEKDLLIKAFVGIQRLLPDNPYSFFQIAGFHGEPFRGPGAKDASWWGGYCNHGNVLFPTWHRAYLLRLENALRSIDGCEEVAMPYWNELIDPIPPIFLQKSYTYADGTIEKRNPLYSYKLQDELKDEIPLSDTQPTDYSKPVGYETCRYPYSGLCGGIDIARATDHNNEMNKKNAQSSGYTDRALQNNVAYWVNVGNPLPGKTTEVEGLKKKYILSLDAPNYTVFSNTTSAGHWNTVNGGKPGFQRVVPLESPHNGMHLAIGGIEVPGQDADVIPYANGDMGENDTAAMDPIFFFHHAWVDLVFWAWQTKSGNTSKLVIEDPTYPGTNSNDEQGPTAGVDKNVTLTLDSPLRPFKFPLDDDNQNFFTSNDFVNIENLDYEKTHCQSYRYDLSKVNFGAGDNLLAPGPVHHLAVSNITRDTIAGSFLISASVRLPGDKNLKLVGFEPVLSRWHVKNCANCGKHTDVKALFPLHGLTLGDAKGAEFQVLVHTRQNRDGAPPNFGAPPGEGEGQPEPKWELVENPDVKE